MKDLVNELNAVHRAVGTGSLPAGEAHVVTLTRTYRADVDDVWDALTDPVRIVRWFLPVSGDLHLGGNYQLEGNAGGEIRVCEPPTHLQVTWVMGDPNPAGDASIVDVRLEATDDGTRLVLEHSAVVPPEFWDQFGPGAVGVGWDMTVLGLGMHLADEEMGDPRELEQSPALRAYMTASSDAWGDANRAHGTDPDVAARMVAATTEFYVPPSA